MRERGGCARAFKADTESASLHRPVFDNVALGSIQRTDGHGGYERLGGIFHRHDTTNRGADEYVRDGASANSIESFWRAMKRGPYGVRHRVGKKHLHRYYDGFTFRLNDGDVKRNALDRLASLATASFGRCITCKELTA